MLDIQSILVVLLTNVFATAIALPWLMGWRVSAAARFFQLGVVVHAFGWLFFLIAPSVHDQALSTVSVALLSTSFGLMWQSLDAWLGRRPGRIAIWTLAVLTPLAYCLSFSNYPWRAGLSNMGLALQMAIVVVTLAKPAPQASMRWRSLVMLCMTALCIVTAWRGVLGAFFTEAYPFFRATHPVNIAAALLNHVGLAMMPLGLLAAWREEAERKLKRQAQTDGLTGLANRQSFTERAADLLSHAERYGMPLSLAMIDVDHFKRINDTHGHAAGDAALQFVAQGLRACIRRGDLVCRYGGEEFCALLLRADDGDAARFDARLRAWLKAHQNESGVGLIDYSAGVAMRLAGGQTLDDMIRRADAALYEAKANGRGQLVAARKLEQAELGFEKQA